jgi:hypothetical protein
MLDTGAGGGTMMVRAIGRGAFFISLAFGWAACGDTTERSTGSSGTGGPECRTGSACFPDGATCTDGSCCPCQYRCEDGSWEVEACAGCAAPECPAVAPADGDACDSCSAPTDPCSYELCDGPGIVTARCLAYAESPDRVWQIEATACTPAPPCGEDPSAPPCPEGQLCVEAEVVAGPSSTVTYSCEDNPCHTSGTSCDCAAALCAATAAPMCVSATPRVVQCTNGAQ